MAERIGAGSRTVRRWLTDPDKIEELGWKVETAPAIGGHVQYRIYEVDAEESEAEKAVALAAADPCLCEVAEAGADKPALDRFEALLHKKLMHKTGAARASLERYYRDQYQASGRIPKGLLHRDGRKAAGRKGGLEAEVEQRFCEMVKTSATARHDHPDFLTRNLRKVTVFHRMLCAEFGTDRVNLSALYRAKQRYNLERYFQQPDYEDGEAGGEIFYFNPEAVFDLIQMDGCTFKYIEIKDELGRWRKPIVIEFYDTGSRYMVAMDVYFSESSENSVDVFSQFLTAMPFPQKTVRLRPDKAGGFQNLRRPIHELNLKHSTPDGFFLDADFPRAYNPKAKVHLETSHRRLHDFEAWILETLKDKIVERRPGQRFKPNGQMEKITVSRIGITLEELKATGLIQEYRDEHNERPGRFSVAGQREYWKPRERMEAYMAEVDTLTFTEADVDQYVKYGYEKKKATVQKNGRITYAKADWKVVEGDFSRAASTPVKISEVNGKLIIFEDKPDGVALGEAMPVTEFQKPEFVESRAKARLKENEFELLHSFLENAGMVVNHERLMGLYREGLDLNTAMDLVKAHEHRYNNPRYGEKGGFIAFNLFISDFMSAGRSAVKPYAEAVN
jgi:hypothetical protein